MIGPFDPARRAVLRGYESPAAEVGPGYHSLHSQSRRLAELPQFTVEAFRGLPE